VPDTVAGGPLMQVDAYKCDRCGVDLKKAQTVQLHCMTHRLRDVEPRSTLDYCKGCIELLKLWTFSDAYQPRAEEPPSTLSQADLERLNAVMRDERETETVMIRHDVYAAIRRALRLLLGPFTGRP
jgi:hypothetical protein